VKTPGVGCGAAILRDGRLLLVKRLKDPEAGCWNLPGGKVEFGEHAAEAAQREIAEELGIEILVTRLLGVVEMLGEGQHWVSPIFAAAIIGGEPVNAEPDKHEAVVWASLDDPPAPLALGALTAIEALRRPA
jgi:ADP-ribose pyrophosphatase YjhB (NUDIX family)